MRVSLDDAIRDDQFTPYSLRATITARSTYTTGWWPFRTTHHICKVQFPYQEIEQFNEILAKYQGLGPASEQVQIDLAYEGNWEVDDTVRVAFGISRTAPHTFKWIGIERVYLAVPRAHREQRGDGWSKTLYLGWELEIGWGKVMLAILSHGLRPLPLESEGYYSRVPIGGEAVELSEADVQLIKEFMEVDKKTQILLAKLRR